MVRIVFAREVMSIGSSSGSGSSGGGGGDERCRGGCGGR